MHCSASPPLCYGERAAPGTVGAPNRGEIGPRAQVAALSRLGYFDEIRAGNHHQDRRVRRAKTQANVNSLSEDLSKPRVEGC